MLTREELTKWTTALRANPEQQITGKLTTDGETGFCCLGKLCQVMGLVAVQTLPHIEDYYEFDRAYTALPKELSIKFGSHNGNFEDLGMPYLKGNFCAVNANDLGVPWSEIADHFDKYYPCSDEVIK